MNRDLEREFVALTQELADLSDRLVRLREKFFGEEDREPPQNSGGARRSTARRKDTDGAGGSREVVCKYCGAGGLHFEEDDGGWRLFYDNGTRHGCGRFKRLDGRRRNSEFSPASTSGSAEADEHSNFGEDYDTPF